MATHPTNEVFPYTPYGNLKEGDEFVRLGGRPVLLNNLSGEREGHYFRANGILSVAQLPITKITKSPYGNWLEEVDA